MLAHWPGLLVHLASRSLELLDNPLEAYLNRPGKLKPISKAEVRRHVDPTRLALSHVRRIEDWIEEQGRIEAAKAAGENVVALRA